MNWNDYKKHLNEGINADSLRQFHHSLIKVQVHWIASLGQTRRHFLIVTGLGFPMFLFALWAVNYTEMGAFDTLTAPALSVLIWGCFYYPLYIMITVYPISITLSALTGAFFKEFWVAVELIKIEFSKVPKSYDE